MWYGRYSVSDWIIKMSQWPPSEGVLECVLFLGMFAAGYLVGYWVHRRLRE